MDNIGIYLKDLLKTKKVSDNDIFIVEDDENTKQISFRDLKLSLISDNEVESPNRIFSSKKVIDLILESTNGISDSIGKLENSLSILDRNKVSNTQLQSAIKNIDDMKANVDIVNNIISELENTRKNTDKISGADILHGSEDEKLHLAHLGSDILDAMTGKTQVSIPSVPVGGWISEDLANGCIKANKLAKDYNYKGSKGVTDLNRLVETGLYVVASSSVALPHFGDDESESRLVEVIRYGENGKYIIQRVYYHEFISEQRPYFERKGLFAKLSILEFTPHFEITSLNKVESVLLGDHYNNRGVLNSGDLFKISADGNYYCKSTVKNLPTDDDYIVSIRTFDNRKEYDCKKITPNGCIGYICYEYYTSDNSLIRTNWLSSNNIMKSKFDGKTLHIFGDGISFGLGSSDILKTSYPAILSNKYGWNIINHSLSDATASSYNDDILKQTSILTQIDRATGLTTNEEIFVIIFVGSEDYRCRLGIIGNNNDNEDTTFKGGLNLIINKILSRAPKAKIIFITPIYRASVSPADNNSGDITLINDKVLKDYVDAINDISKYNHIPCIDLYSTGMINKYNKFKYLNDDGIYPKDYGHNMIAEKIHNGFCEFY